MLFLPFHEWGNKKMTSKRSAVTFSLCNKPHGVISSNNILERTEYYDRRTKKCLGLAESHRLLKIGHQAGSFQRYPKDPEKISKDTADISELMKKSFEDYRLDGIEIDIQVDCRSVVDEANRDIYIVHDNLESSPGPYATDYLKRNTLQKVLKVFTDAKYHEKGKYIYIEIKCKNSERLDNRDKEAISGALKVIDDVIRESSAEVAKEIRKHIGFASFNYMALETIDELAIGYPHDSLEENYLHCRYVRG